MSGYLPKEETLLNRKQNKTQTRFHTKFPNSNMILQTRIQQFSPIISKLHKALNF